MSGAVDNEIAADDERLLFPCSSSQERCWFVDAMDRCSPALNVALRWELSGPIDEALVERAFNTIVERHEVLRTRFVERDGTPMQEVAPRLRLKLAVVDLRSLAEDTRPTEARRLAEREAHVPFDIHDLPLVRITLLRLAADKANILLTVHQIVFDGWSIRVIAHEFGEIIGAYGLGRPHTLPEVPVQYGDYARWQVALLASEAAATERYWYDQLAFAPYFEVKGDFEKPARPTHRGMILAQMLAPELGGRMEEEARQRGVTSFVMGCAATLATLKRISGRTDIILGTQIAGRDDADLEPLIGVFINNLVLRVDTRHAFTFAELMGRANETVRAALIHQRMPFHRLVELINPPRDPARTPLISVNFTLLKEVLDYKQYGGFRLQGLPSVSAGSLYDLNFFVVKWHDGWRMAMEYNPDVFLESTAQGIFRLWRETMERALAERDFDLDTLMVPEREVPPAQTSVKALSAPATQGAPSASVLAAEAALAEIWRPLLGVDEVGPASNFFELGGHSMLAVRLLARIEARFGRRLDPLTLFEAPTLRQLAFKLAEHEGGEVEGAVEDWNIVAIQPGGDKVPIFAINNTLAYYNVARAIGTQRPFFGVQLFNPSAPRALEERPLEEVAADYVRLIRTARPHGPYILTGLCVAGAIAYEAACQLEAAGEAVPLLVLSDTWLPGYLAGLPAADRKTFRWAYRKHVARHHRAELAAGRISLPDVLATYRIVRRSGLLRVAAAVGLIENRPYAQEDWGNRWFLPVLERARDAYKARPFGGQVILLRSDEMLTSGVGPRIDHQMGWGPLLRVPAASCAVPGWHAGMFQDAGARVIAERLRPWLDRVEDDGGARAAAE
ncbi:condensation domain-containing protein [Xanthobacteraceae bacterium A53D]